MFKVAEIAPTSAAFALLPRSFGAVLMPIGLSYYVFKLASYLLDVHWEAVDAERSPTPIALYAAFFPQIPCGPIQRWSTFRTQLDGLGAVSRDQVVAGLRLILVGLFAKAVVADRLGPIVDLVYARPNALTPAVRVLAAHLFVAQLYADFSGFTDMSRGIAMLFGIEAPLNFDRPFVAKNIQEFWRRWHMSLSSWLADYVFTPTSVALRDFGKLGLAIAVAANFLLIGAWHGLRWTFLVFGAMHATFTIVSVFTLKKRDRWFGKRPALARVRAIGGRLWLLQMIATSLVFFRAGGLAEAWSIVGAWPRGWLAWLTHPRAATAAFHGDVLHALKAGGRDFVFDVGALALLIAIHSIGADADRRAAFARAPRVARWAAYYAIVLVILRFGVLESRTFVYAQF
jgi:D-alanyl-lipoteichoic acid acyltransferase DltB (MBOAT superfamily)